MRSPTTAILWEVWARNRWPLVIAVGLLPVSVAFIGLTNRLYPLRTFQEPAPFLWIFAAVFAFMASLMSLACLFWSFSFTAVDERGRFAGFPLRLFTLPVRTRRAVGVPLFSGLITILLAYLAWFVCVTRLLLGTRLPAGETLPDGRALAWQLLVIATAYVCMQVAIWLLYPARNLRVVVLSVIATAFLCLWMLIPDLQLNQHPVPWFSGMAVLFVAAVAGAFKVVDWDRRGGWQGTMRLRGMGGAYHLLTPFRSAAWAQFWFEWRRKGWFGAVVIGSIMGLSLFLWPVPRFFAGELELTPAWSPPEPVELLVFWSFPVLAIAATSAVASGFGKPDLWLPEMLLPSFHATRPVTTASLVFAKMRTAAVVVLVAWGVFLLFVAGIVIRAHLKPEASTFWLSFVPRHPALWSWLTHPAALLMILAVQWHAFTSGMCPILSGTRRHIILHGTRAGARVVAVLGIVVWCYSHPWDIEFWLLLLPSLTVALAIWKVCWTWIQFRRAAPLLVRGQVESLLALWVGVCVLIAAAAWVAQQLHAMPWEIMWFFAAWFMPSGEMAACVTNLDRNRHR